MNQDNMLSVLHNDLFYVIGKMTIYFGNLEYRVYKAVETTRNVFNIHNEPKRDFKNQVGFLKNRLLEIMEQVDYDMKVDDLVMIHNLDLLKYLGNKRDEYIHSSITAKFSEAGDKLTETEIFNIETKFGKEEITINDILNFINEIDNFSDIVLHVNPWIINRMLRAMNEGKLQPQT